VNFAWYLTYVGLIFSIACLCCWILPFRKDWKQKAELVERLEDLDEERTKDVIIVYSGNAVVSE
jgi:hypothetical protein